MLQFINVRWWKELNFKEKLPYARDRLVEIYFWALGVHFEPQYSLSRKFLAKVSTLTTILDDTFDVYGTLEELVLLTDAIDRFMISPYVLFQQYSLHPKLKKIHTRLAVLQLIHELKNFYPFSCNNFRGIFESDIKDSHI